MCSSPEDLSLKTISHFAPRDIVNMELSGSIDSSSSEWSGKNALSEYLLTRHCVTTGPVMGFPKELFFQAD